MISITFDRLSNTRFEEFCFDLLHASGFVNIDWRKGTGLSTSPADKGRDIVCDLRRCDPDGTQYFEKYFVDCKHFKKGVPAKELRNLLAWAEADRPDVAVFAVSNFLSNSAKDYIDPYTKNNHPPFKIKNWERPQLVRMMARRISLQRKYNLTSAPIRSVRQILAAEDELGTRLWYGRSMSAENMRARGTPEEIIRGGTQGATRCRAEIRQKKPHGKCEERLGLGLSQWEGISDPVGSGRRLGHARQLSLSDSCPAASQWKIAAFTGG